MPKFIMLHQCVGLSVISIDHIVAVFDNGVNTSVLIMNNENPLYVEETPREVMEMIKEASDAEG